MTDLLNGSVRQGDDVVFRELDGESVILNLASGVYFGLDCVGTRVWLLVEQYGDLHRVLAAMREEYEVADDVLERDLARLVGELIDKRLLIRSDAAGVS